MPSRFIRFGIWACIFFCPASLWAAGFSNAAGMSGSRFNQTATLLPSGKVLVVGGKASSALKTAELYDPVANTWTAAASLTMARELHTATLLSNGKVLVVGGAGSSSLASCELYDPVANSWSSGGTLTTARDRHTATLLPNGKVLVAAGQTNTTSISSAELYDPSTNSWSSANSLTGARILHAAVLLPTGKVIVIGGLRDGTNGQEEQLYDPATNSWSLPWTMSNARGGHSATLLPNGKVLVAGGRGPADTTSRTEIYDPIDDLWASGPDLLTGRCTHCATLLPNGKVLITGGVRIAGSSTLLQSAELYDPVANSFSSAGNMSVGRTSFTTTMLANSRVLLAAGFGPVGAQATTEFYDPTASLAWTSAGNLDAPREGPSATMLPDGRVLVVGGYNNGTWLTTCQLYNSAGNSWSAAGSLSTARANQSATLLTNGQVLVAGGTSNGGGTRTVELYDPASNSWSAAASMARARFGHTATLLSNGKVLVAGGFSAEMFAEIYDPAANSWTSVPNMASARRFHSAILLKNGNALVIGGADGANAISACEVFDPIANMWSPAASLAAARADHAVAMLPNGNVLAVGGNGAGYLASAEIYDSALNTWAPAGSISVARQYPVVAVLNNGRVLVAGGRNSANSLATVDLYTPGLNTWTAVSSLTTPRHYHRAVTLLNGKVVVIGGYDTTAIGVLASAELYDPGLQYQPAYQPTITSAPDPAFSGSPMGLTGTKFTGISEGCSGQTTGSPANFPIVQLRSLSNGQTLLLTPGSQSFWTATSYTSIVLPTFPAGFATLTVFANGIPSISKIILVNATQKTPTSVTTANVSVSYNDAAQTVALTATLTPANLNESSVTFQIKNDAVDVGTAVTVSVSNSGASADYALPAALPPAVYTIQATYSGTTTYAASQDVSKTLTIHAPTTVTAANKQAGYSTNVQNVTLTASVSSSATVNAGTVTFRIKNGAAMVGNPISVAVVAGTASVSYLLPAGLAANQYSIEAVYNGSPAFEPNSDTSRILVINQAATTVTAVTTAAPVSATDQTVNLTAAVTSPGGIIREGSAVFQVKNGAENLGVAVSAAVTSGSATVAYVIPGGTALGDYTIEVSYSGTNFAASADSLHFLRVVVPNSMAAENTAIFYKSAAQNVTLNATVTGAAGPVNEGAVTFQIKNGAVNVGTAAVSPVVNNGAASAVYSIPAGTPVGAYSIFASYSGGPNYPPSSDNSKLLTIQQAATSTTGVNATANYSAAPQNVTLTAQVASPGGTVNQGTVTFTVKNGATVVGTPATSATLSAGSPSVNYTLPADTAPGTYTIQADYSGSTNFGVSSGNATLTVQKTLPAITWNNPANIEYGTALGASQLNATTTVAGSFAYTPAAGAFLQIGANQNLSVVFTPNDTSKYLVANKSVTVTVTKKALTVKADDLTKVYGSPNPTLTYTLSGFVFGDTQAVVVGAPGLTTTALTSSPPGNYPITITSGSLSAANYSFTLVNGTLNISTMPVFSQLSAPSVQYKTADTTLSGKISFGAVGVVVITFNGVSRSATIDGSGGFAASFSTGALELGSYPIQYYYPGGGGLDPISAGRTLTVIPATPVIAWTAPQAIPYETALGSTQLSATTAMPGTFVYTPPDSTVLPAGSHQLSVAFSPQDKVHYVSASAGVMLTVTRATPVLTWPSPADIPYGTALGGTQLNATASTVGTFTYSPAEGTVLATGDGHLLQVTFVPDDAQNYVSASETVTINVVKAEQTIAFDTIPEQEFGNPPVTLVANSSSNLPVTFTLISGPATLNGAQITLQGLGAVTIRADQAGDENFYPAPPVDQTFNIVINAPKITSALTASGTQNQPFSYALTATGTRPITFEALNVPNGLSLIAATGDILGTPTASGAFQATATVRNAAGADTRVLTFVFASASGNENHPPQATSSPAALPNPAAVNQEVNFSVGANDPDGDSVAIVWEFGDGSFGFSANVNHRYLTPGIYAVKVTLTDGAASDYLNQTVVINSVLIPSEEYRKFTVDKASLKFNFAAPGKDSLSAAGSVPISAGFAPDGAIVNLNIAALFRTFTLTTKGASSDKALKLTGGLKNGRFTASPVKFSITLKNQNLFADLQALGFVNDVTPKGMTVKMPLVLTVADTRYLAMVNMKYAAKKDKSGTGKK